MTATLAVSWNDTKRTGRLLAATCLGAAALLSLNSPAGYRAVAQASSDLASVIVRQQPGAGEAARAAVRAQGGHLGTDLSIIDGFSAEVPAGRIAEIEKAPAVASVSRDRPGRLLGYVYGNGIDHGLNPMADVTSSTGARDYWRAGFTGRGIDVALIDSGVVPVEGLTTEGKVVNGPDLTPESDSADTRYLDSYGHGTHMAGIIAGRDGAAVAGAYDSDRTDFLGMAPDARIVNVKVATGNGQTSDAVVIQALDWVVQHRQDSGLNIRVINLSYGGDNSLDPGHDALAQAAERAWKAGILVVAAAGNDGNHARQLMSPAYDPKLLAVGAACGNGAYATAAAYSSSGRRAPDVVAPGSHVVSLRDPGSFLDRTYGSSATVDSRFFRGSGTSQAAAVVSGAAALLFQEHPGAAPDKIKHLLTESTYRISGDGATVGHGDIELTRVLGRDVGKEPKPEARVNDNPVGSPALSGGWSGSSWSGSSWSGSSWSGSSWSGSSWSGSSWSGSSWSGSSWSGSSWSGSSWSGSSWSGSSWSGSSWSAAGWY